MVIFGNRLFQYDWLQLSAEIRQKLVKIFAIPRSEGSHVQDNVQITDGYTQKDLDTVTLESMQKYLGSTEPDFVTLLRAVIKSIEPTEEPKLPQAEARKREIGITITVDGKKYEAIETTQEGDATSTKDERRDSIGHEATAGSKKTKTIGKGHPLSVPSQKL